jgi:hypothetical protein
MQTKQNKKQMMKCILRCLHIFLTAGKVTGQEGKGGGTVPVKQYSDILENILTCRLYRNLKNL